MGLGLWLDAVQAVIFHLHSQLLFSHLTTEKRSSHPYHLSFAILRIQFNIDVFYIKFLFWKFNLFI